MDLEKPGFFHFDRDLVEGNLPRERATYWYKKQKEKLELWDRQWLEAGAIENTIGVFVYVLQGTEKATEYFEAILRKPGRPQVNTLANLIFLHGEDSEIGRELHGQLEAIQNEDSTKSKLELTKGMCERGYFCGFYIAEEVHNPDLVQISSDLLKMAIEKGKILGMSHNEVCIWQNYHFKALKDVFVHEVVTQNKCDAFEDVMTSFLEFYCDIEDGDNYYQSNSLMEMAIMFTIQKDEIEQHPKFSKFCQEEDTLREIWDDVTLACEEAIAMCPTNYRLHLKAARLYSRLGLPEKAQKSIDESLEINHDLNLSTMHFQMTLYHHQGFKSAVEDEDHFAAAEWYQKAYSCGKEIEQTYEYVIAATFVEMHGICFNLAIDRSARPWKVHPGKDLYLTEAIAYGEKALDSLYHTESPRALIGLAKCYAMKYDFIEAAKYAKQAAHTDRPGKIGNLLNYLRYLSEKYHQYRQDDTVDEIASAFDLAWQKHPKSTALDMLVKYANLYIAKKNRLIKHILDGLSRGRSETSADVLKEFCLAITGNPCKTQWLKDLCQSYL